MNVMGWSFLIQKRGGAFFHPIPLSRSFVTLFLFKTRKKNSYLIETELLLPWPPVKSVSTSISRFWGHSCDTLHIIGEIILPTIVREDFENCDSKMSKNVITLLTLHSSKKILFGKKDQPQRWKTWSESQQKKWKVL